MPTNLTTITTPSQLLAMPNVSTGGNFYLAMLITTFFILTMTMIKYGIKRAVIASSFICVLLTLLLSYGGLVGINYTFGFVAILVLTVGATFFDSSKEI